MRSFARAEFLVPKQRRRVPPPAGNACGVATDYHVRGADSLHRPHSHGVSLMRQRLMVLPRQLSVICPPRVASCRCWKSERAVFRLNIS
jgi:hypothetical protein